MSAPAPYGFEEEYDAYVADVLTYADFPRPCHADGVCRVYLLWPCAWVGVCVYTTVHTLPKMISNYLQMICKLFGVHIEFAYFTLF